MKKVRAVPHSAINAQRREALISACIDEIATAGLQKLTLANIAARAKLTAGAVNFYFDSKDALLLEVLRVLVEEVDQALVDGLAQAGRNPKLRLEAVFEAFLNTELVSPRKVAVWYSFASLTHTSPDYQALIEPKYDRWHEMILAICEDIIALDEQQRPMSANAIAYAIDGIIDQFWGDVQSEQDNFNAEEAKQTYQAFLASVFPWAFAMPVNAAPGAKEAQGDQTFLIRQAGPEDAPNIASLIELGGHSRNQHPDAAGVDELARAMLREQPAITLIASDEQAKTAGFAHFREWQCLESGERHWTLGELYVDAAFPSSAVVQRILEMADSKARHRGVTHIDAVVSSERMMIMQTQASLGYFHLPDTQVFRSSLT